MKVLVKKEKLLKSLQKVQGVIEKRTTMPILNNLLIECSDNLTIKATNLEISMVVKEEANVIEKGSLCVPAKKLFEIIKALPEEEVTIELSEKNANIKSGKTSFKLFTYAPEDFPIIKSLEKTNRKTIDKDKFFQSIEKVEYAIYPDETRESLNGVLIHKVDDKLRFVASDGFRLAYNEFTFSEGCEDVLIPKKTVGELLKLKGEGDEVINFYVSNFMIMVECGNTTLISKLKEAKFPNYRDVIPNNPYKLYVNKEEMLETLKRVSIISEESTRSIILSITENKVTVKTTNADLGYAEDEVSCQYEGTPFDICFNARFLIEAIEPIEAETVLLEFRDAQTAAVISGDQYYKAVLMPIRL